MFVTSGDGAAFFIGGIFGPGAITGAGVEDQLSGASEVVLLAFDAREHHVAAGRVGMLEHAVPARAVTDRPGGFCRNQQEEKKFFFFFLNSNFFF